MPASKAIYRALDVYPFVANRTRNKPRILILYVLESHTWRLGHLANDTHSGQLEICSCFLYNSILRTGGRSPMMLITRMQWDYKNTARDGGHSLPSSYNALRGTREEQTRTKIRPIIWVSQVRSHSGIYGGYDLGYDLNLGLETALTSSRFLHELREPLLKSITSLFSRALLICTSERKDAEHILSWAWRW
jgi:hypothetical protein